MHRAGCCLMTAQTQALRELRLQQPGFLPYRLETLTNFDVEGVS